MNKNSFFEWQNIKNYIILFLAPISYEFLRSIIYNIFYSSLHAAYTVISCISCIVCSLFLYFAFYRHVNNDLIKRKLRSPKIKCNHKMIPWLILAGMAGCYIFNAVVIISKIPNNAINSYKVVSDVLYSGEFLLVFLEIVILAPITEELLFRGIVYQCMIPNVGRVIAAIISLIFFAVFHGNILQGLYASVMTIFLVLFYERFKSLAACIIFHMSANLLSFLGTKTTFLNVFFCSKQVIIMNVFFSFILLILCIMKMSTNRCCRLKSKKQTISDNN